MNRLIIVGREVITRMSRGWGVGGYQICSCPQTIYSTINSVIRDHNSNALHVTALLRCWKRGCHNPSFCT